MMKACIMKATLLVLLAGVALSANAKLGDARQWERPVLTAHQGSELIVAAGLATSTLGSTRIDLPISASKRPRKSITPAT
jgi:hypothetical protein